MLSDLVGLDAVGLTFLVISSLAAALIARLQSLVVTLLAGIAVGLCTALLTPVLLWPNSTYSLSNYRCGAPFVLAIVALLILARSRVVSDLASGGLTEVLPELGVGRSTIVRALVIGAVLVFVLFALPPLLSVYWIKVMTAAAIFSIVALGLNLLFGRVGLVSLGQIALLVVGELDRVRASCSSPRSRFRSSCCWRGCSRGRSARSWACRRCG